MSKKLTKKQVAIIKEIFNNDFNKKLLAIQGNISVLTELAEEINEGKNYSIVQSNLSQLL